MRDKIKVIDFRFHRRIWGHNFQLTQKLNEDGTRWQIAMWIDEAPNLGDLLLLGLKPFDNRVYKVEQVRCCGNPKDRYFIEMEFLPRSVILQHKIYRNLLESMGSFIADEEKTLGKYWPKFLAKQWTRWQSLPTPPGELNK